MFSGRKRSGLNDSGSGKYRSSLKHTRHEIYHRIPTETNFENSFPKNLYCRVEINNFIRITGESEKYWRWPQLLVLRNDRLFFWNKKISWNQTKNLVNKTDRDGTSRRLFGQSWVLGGTFSVTPWWHTPNMWACSSPPFSTVSSNRLLKPEPFV